ncbi:unnamed protein product [Allacma fusca]|uniref:Right handed beta helix domain-containing protein n=1 Tax=Allacma fusca TaxID=39272 RepID=A0A8J2JZ92_9HEXA|nr:unnamed protein product [Allacma fusca]
MWSYQLTAVAIVLIASGYSAQARIVKAGPAELQSALDSASPGDTIQLLPTTYNGEYFINKDASPNVPITLTGDTNSTIVSEGSTGITVRGSNWVLKSFKITGPAIGVLVEGTGNSLEGLVIQGVGQGIVVRGPDNKIKSCVISEAGSGVVLESGDRTTMQYNSINIQTPAIIVSEQTCCGLLDGNVANGVFEVKGNGYTLMNNVANHGLHISGCDNSAAGNVANGASFPKQCELKDLGGNVYRGTGPNDTDEPSRNTVNGNNGNYNGNPPNNNYNGNPPNNNNNGQYQNSNGQSQNNNGQYQNNNGPNTSNGIPTNNGQYQNNNGPSTSNGIPNNNGPSAPSNPSNNGHNSGSQGSYATNPGGQGKPPCRCSCEWQY